MTIFSDKGSGPDGPLLVLLSLLLAPIATNASPEPRIISLVYQAGSAGEEFSATSQTVSMDFVADQLSNGRRFMVLNVVDDYNREMVGQLVSISISGRQVARFLDDLILERQRPKTIICDNGTEFTSKAMFFWSQETGVKLGFIQPGKPTQNAFVESLNGKFRKECLNAHWFRSLDAARDIIDQWRHHYNHERPHSSLNYLSPVDFAQQAA